MTVTPSPSHEIRIRYTRPPDGITTFRQRLVHRAEDCIVTLLEHADVRSAMRIRDEIVLEPGAPIVWFTFPGVWHDIGRFHTADGRFTGFYANILTPVEIVSPSHWHTTDLFLDVWLDDAGTDLLDAAELATAVAAGHVTAGTAARAHAEADAVIRAAAAGTWPPVICREWTLDRAMKGTRGTRGGDAV